MGGISSGANMCAAAQVAARPEFAGKRIVTIMCSLGEQVLVRRITSLQLSRRDVGPERAAAAPAARARCRARASAP